MDTMEEHLSNRMKVEGMDIAGKHMVVDKEERVSNRAEVEGMDLGWVERVHGGVMMPQHWIDNRAEMNLQIHR
jgi:hypothetical protein